MKIYFDAEFLEDGKTIDLISIGMVREDGEELYCINKDCDWKRIYNDEWLYKNVVPHLDKPGTEAWLSKNDIAKKMLKFTSGINPEFWAWYCVAPQTRVLTSQLEWVPIGDVSVGDILVGFDEHTAPGFGRSSRWRQWREAHVTKTSRLLRPSYLLTFSDGTTITCSKDHQWLVNSGNSSTQWVTTEKLEVGGAKTRSSVVKPLDTWEFDTSREGGYLAAALDGEGHITQLDLRDTATSNPVQTYRTSLGFAQKDNAMLAEVKRIMNQKGYTYTIGSYNGINRLSIANRHDFLRILGSVRPLRLLDKFDAGRLGAMSLTRSVSLIGKEYLGDSEVVALTTSTGTYIAEGLASHNCSYDWVVLCQLFGKMIDLPSNWPMYCRDFKQVLDSSSFEKINMDSTEEHHALNDAKWLKKEYERYEEYEHARNTK